MKHSLSLIFCFLSVLGYSQNPLFLSIDQAYAGDHASTIGNGCGDRLSTSYRHIFTNTQTEWKDFQINYDKPFQLKNGDQIGVGISLEYSRNFIAEQKIGTAMMSYRKRLPSSKGNTQFLSGGVGFQMTALAYNRDIRWPSQIGPNGFDPTNGNYNVLYPSVDLSLGYSLAASKDEFVHFAATIKGLNTPTVSLFLGDPREIDPLFLLNVSGSMIATSSILWQPQLQVLRNTFTTNYRFHSNFKIKFGDNNHQLITGVGYSNLELYTISLGLEYKRFRTIAFYDVHASTPFSNSLELMVGYRFCD